MYKLLHHCGKRVKTKSQKVFGANSYVCRSYRGKTGRGMGSFCPPIPILNRVNTYSIIMPKHFLYLVYVRPCLDVDLFMTYLCDLFFFFTLIIINQIISLKQTHFFFCKFFQNTPYYFWKSKESKRKKRKQIIFNKQKFSLRVLLSFCLIFFANFSLVLLIKKSVYSISEMLENKLLVNFSNY